MKAMFVLQLLMMHIALLVAKDADRTDKWLTAPVVIVFSEGRSGSTWLCEDVIGNLKKGAPNLHTEILGSNPTETLAVEDPLYVVQSFLSTQLKLFPGKTIGFKWKPTFVNSTIHNKVFEWVAKYQSTISGYS